MKEFKDGDNVTIIESEWNDTDTVKLIGQSGVVVYNYSDCIYKVLINDKAVRCYFEELKLT